MSIDLDSYQQHGFIHLENVLSDADFAPLEQRFLSLVNERCNANYSHLQEPDLIASISNDRELEQYLYGEIRRHSELETLSKHTSITGAVRQLLDDLPIVLLGKIPFRIDCPMVMRELAVWHQDYFYVKGHTDTITAWFPLFDSGFSEGCLLVMPGSQHEGVIEHDVPVLGKKWYPSAIFNREVRYVPMKRGDVLLFHSCLLHSSGNNIGDKIRYSVQSRYTKSQLDSDPNMGERVAIQ